MEKGNSDVYSYIIMQNSLLHKVAISKCLMLPLICRNNLKEIMFKTKENQGKTIHLKKRGETGKWRYKSLICQKKYLLGLRLLDIFRTTCNKEKLPSNTEREIHNFSLTETNLAWARRSGGGWWPSPPARRSSTSVNKWSSTQIGKASHKWLCI